MPSFFVALTARAASGSPPGFRISGTAIVSNFGLTSTSALSQLYGLCPIACPLYYYEIAWLMPSAMTSGLAARPPSNVGLVGRLRDATSCWAISLAATLSVAGPTYPLRRYQLLGCLGHCDIAQSVVGPSCPLQRYQLLGRLARCNITQSHGHIALCNMI